MPGPEKAISGHLPLQIRPPVKPSKNHRHLQSPLIKSELSVKKRLRKRLDKLSKNKASQLRKLITDMYGE